MAVDCQADGSDAKVANLYGTSTVVSLNAAAPVLQSTDSAQHTPWRQATAKDPTTLQPPPSQYGGAGPGHVPAPHRGPSAALPPA